MLRLQESVVLIPLGFAKGYFVFFLLFCFKSTTVRVLLGMWLQDFYVDTSSKLTLMGKRL